MRCDIVCVGSGVAGLTASIVAAQAGVNVCVVTKEPFGWGNTRISGGIIASRGENGQNLSTDMTKAGALLNNPALIQALLDNSRDVHELVESWGHLFQREESNPSQRIVIKPGGHSIPRTYVSHHRGLSLANILRSKLLTTPVAILEEVAVTDVIVRNSVAHGVVGYDWRKGEWIAVIAPVTILACGGAGMIYYPHSDNMRSATGDGYALGLRAGARLINMEQVQFIPFGVASPAGMVGLELGDTSAAGPYGVLKNRHGEVIAANLPAKTREEVSQLIAREVAKGNGSPNGGVWLDPTENRRHPDGERAWQHWKRIGSLEPLRMAYGTMAYQWRESFEVCPTQHYVMGGIVTDAAGRTDVKGLMAVGETAGGLHGAGRMGGMSLFEGLVFGRIAGEEAVRLALGSQALSDREWESVRKNETDANLVVHENPFQLKKSVGQIMWDHVGLDRNRDSLELGYRRLLELEEELERTKGSGGPQHRHLVLETIELRSMIITAKAVTQSALCREESRGSHFRTDFPGCKSEWQGKHVVVTSNQNNLYVQVEE